MPLLTSAQRSYLEAMSAHDIKCVTVRSGGSVQCVQRLIRLGLVQYVANEKDRRDAVYRITEPGRVAIAANG